MPEASVDDSKLSSLLSFCTSEWRICPQPQAWHRIWLALKSGAQDRRKTGYDIALSVDVGGAARRLRYEPPRPNILSSWSATSDVQKMETLRKQLVWAAQHAVLDVADGLLRSLTMDEWRRSGEPSTSSVDQFIEDERRLKAFAERARQVENRQMRLDTAQAHRDRKVSVDCDYASKLDQDLLRAYRATAYQVFAEPEFALRIGERSARLAELFDRNGKTCAAYITAWNPKGAACDPSFNAAAQERLAASVKELGLEYLKGEGKGEIGDWPPEESLLILGCTRSRAKKLGHAFKQNAVVWVGANAVPELIMLMPLGMVQSGPPDAA